MQRLYKKKWWWRRRERVQRRWEQFLMIMASLKLCSLGPSNKFKIKTFSRTRFAFFFWFTSLLQYNIWFSSLWFYFYSSYLNNILLFLILHEAIMKKLTLTKEDICVIFVISLLYYFLFVGFIILGPSRFHQFHLTTTKSFFGHFFTYFWKNLPKFWIILFSLLMLFFFFLETNTGKGRGFFTNVFCLCGLFFFFFFWLLIQ